jgi:hypothetical protein
VNVSSILVYHLLRTRFENNGCDYIGYRLLSATNHQMKIAVITPDMSNNATMRAYWLADLLSHDHEVHIIGPQFGDGIYPVVPDDIPLEPTAASPIVPRFLPVMSELVDDISADLVIAVKPRVSSYGTALWHRRRHGTPLMLDIDDWEIGFRLDGGYLKAAVLALPSLAHVNGIGWLAMFERLVRYADEVTVSNPWLRDRFGGEEVVHPRDTTCGTRNGSPRTKRGRDSTFPPMITSSCSSANHWPRKALATSSMLRSSGTPRRGHYIW